MHNIYQIRLLEINKLKNKFLNKECGYLETIHEINIRKEREKIVDRIKELTKKHDIIEANDENFDIKLKNLMENINIYDERGIKSDYSYNLAHIDEFKKTAIDDYKLSL